MAHRVSITIAEWTTASFPLTGVAPPHKRNKPPPPTFPDAPTTTPRSLITTPYLTRRTRIVDDDVLFIACPISVPSIVSCIVCVISRSIPVCVSH